jgi:TraE protein/VirB8 protein
MTNIKNLKTKLEISSYPKLVTDLAYQNHFLKLLAYGLTGVITLLLVVVIFLLKKSPDVIALDPRGTVASVSHELHTSHVEAVAKKYIEYRYSWNPQNIESQLNLAQDFIYSSLKGSFKKSLSETIKFVKDRQVVQKVYPSEIKVDLKNKVVTITADRITEFDSLKAATVLKTTLNFDLDSATDKNPWGIFFTKETENVEVRK